MELDFLVFPQNYPGFATQEAGAGPGPTVPFVFGVRSLLSILHSPLRLCLFPLPHHLTFKFILVWFSSTGRQHILLSLPPFLLPCASLASLSFDIQRCFVRRLHHKNQLSLNKRLSQCGLSYIGLFLL